MSLSLFAATVIFLNLFSYLVEFHAERNAFVLYAKICTFPIDYLLGRGLPADPGGVRGTEVAE